MAEFRSFAHLWQRFPKKVQQVISACVGSSIANYGAGGYDLEIAQKLGLERIRCFLDLILIFMASNGLDPCLGTC